MPVMESSAPLVAVIDDEASICRALSRLLRVENYALKIGGSYNFKVTKKETWLSEV
jgi:hypothetical protein